MSSCTQKSNGVLLLLALLLLLSGGGCSNFGVDLNTDEPIKVDIAVKLDVYQHQDPDAQTATTRPMSDADMSIEERRRRRIGEIQTLKNNRIVGENHLGLLEVRSLPPGEYGDYVKGVVDKENEDRTALMTAMAGNEGVGIVAIQERQAGLFHDRAFNGEWIETQTPDGSYQWEQKAE